VAAIETPLCEFGLPAPDFSLPDPSGKIWTRDQCCGEKGLLVMFICNHCPYVKAVRSRIVRDVNELALLGIGSVAIMSNDFSRYPDDAPDQMAKVAQESGFRFPYLIDEEQAVAHAFGAVCTPDFFGYDASLGLQYRGRLDSSRRETAPEDSRRELFEAMSMVASSGSGPRKQVASIGCSIKWRDE
jgi:peroxiredoxin